MQQFKCHKCHKIKEEDAFYKSSIQKQDYICKVCSKARNKSQRLDRASRNDISQRYSYAKSSAKTTGKPFQLTRQEYEDIVTKNCYYCNKPSGGLGVGLDRIDNDKKIGYVKENVLPCCCFCNKIRGNLLTVEETEVAIKAILNYRKIKNMV